MSDMRAVSQRMGPRDLLVAVSQKFPLPGKNLAAVSRVVDAHLGRLHRRGQIADSYAGPAHDRGTGRALAPTDPGGDVLVVRVEVIAADVNPGLQAGIAALRSGLRAAVAALPDQFGPEQAAQLLATVGGDAMSVSWANRTEVRIRDGLFP
ncbi:hypothetical protein [Pseudonocardia sp. ICBG601]|uniref:hypothetical protein n=1 Tax=Pseudonocardia sp. ICBG601 TaxID=2846759 RepID=UPI001CF6D986|nr:hypothetical protein [Pseudonocardia sp. ICBG601]